MIFFVDSSFIENTKAVIRNYRKGEIVMREGETARNFLYLMDGELIVYNFTEEGKEFLQHKVSKDHFFGEPAVLLDKSFPGNVEVCSDSAKILNVPKVDFLNYMETHPAIMLEFTKSIAEKSIIKSNTLKNLVFQNPKDRICKQLEDYKIEHNIENNNALINLTRKEISNMTGLRVETVIRTIKKMEREGKLKIKKGKIFY